MSAAENRRSIWYTGEERINIAITKSFSAVFRTALGLFENVQIQLSSPARCNIMMPGSKGLNPHELAHRWVKDLGTRPDMSIKVGYISHDMRILGRIVGVRSTEQSVGIIVGVF